MSVISLLPQLTLNSQPTKMNVDTMNTLKKVMAEVLCTKAKVSYPLMRQSLKEHNLNIKLDKKNFNSIYESTATQIIRQLQKYLIVHCRSNIPLMSKEVIRSLIRVIMNFRTIIGHDLSQTLFNFVRYVFKIDHEQLKHAELIKLLDLLVKLSQQLKERRATWRDLKAETIPSNLINKDVQITCKESSLKLQLQKQRFVWSSQHEQYLKKVYRQTYSLNEIRTLLKAEYPELKKLWTNKYIGSKLSIILGKGLNILQQIVINKQYPNLPKLSNITIKQLNKGKAAEKVRTMLIDLVDSRLSRSQLTELVERVNHLVKLAQEYQHKIIIPYERQLRRILNKRIDLRQDQQKQK